jgi:hypothetical protein
VFGDADEVGESVAFEGCLEGEFIDDDVLDGIDDVFL